MAKINRLTHCSFRCNDFEKTLAFYRDILEIPIAFTLRNEDGSVWLTYLEIAPGEFIELFNERYSGKNDWAPKGHHHTCFLVLDIQEAARSLESKGVLLTKGPIALWDPYRIPYKLDCKQGQCNSWCFFVQDPEGNEIEFMQYTAESLQVVNDHD
jgi:catechol 2,3-dioxygenase-like lactoylglutathione lyase family enzyme